MEKDGKPQKEVLPITFCEVRSADRSYRAWRSCGVPAPRPLYRLPHLIVSADKQVLITEGEKKAERACELFPDLEATTTNAAEHKAVEVDADSDEHEAVEVDADTDEHEAVDVDADADEHKAVEVDADAGEHKAVEVDAAADEAVEVDAEADEHEAAEVDGGEPSVEFPPGYSSTKRGPQVASSPTQFDTVGLHPPHSDGPGFTFELRDTFGTTSSGFVQTQLKHIMRVVGSDDGKPDVDAVNAVIAMVDGLRPENEIEAVAAVQIALSHHVSCTMLDRAMSAMQVEHRERYLNLATKLQRTMVAQIEALARLRGRPGAPRVGQVTVEPGGQAIVGTVNVEARGGENGG